MATTAAVPSPPRQRVLTFAERQHLSDQRRAAVLAQRQAERAAKREAQASRKSVASSASPSYDPSAYAARRAAAIAEAKHAEALRRRGSGRFADGEGPPTPVPPRGYFPATPVTPSFPVSLQPPASPTPPPWERAATPPTAYYFSPPPPSSATPAAAGRSATPAAAGRPTPPSQKGPSPSAYDPRQYAKETDADLARRLQGEWASPRDTSPPPPSRPARDASPPPPPHEQEPADDIFRRMIDRDDDDNGWNNDVETAAIPSLPRRKAPPPPKRLKVKPPPQTQQRRMNLSGSPPRSKNTSDKAEKQRRVALKQRREAEATQTEAERPLEDARVLARRREQLLAAELRRAAQAERESQRVPSPPPGRPPEHRRPRPSARVHPQARAPLATNSRPLCVDREKQQRRARQAEANEPDNRRNLDKRTARLRYAPHFAAAIDAHRARWIARSPDDKENVEEDFNAGARVVVRVRPLLPHEAARGDFCAADTDLPPPKAHREQSGQWVTVHECTMHADMVRLLHRCARFPAAACIGSLSSEDDAYERGCLPGLRAALDGRAAALFMFGQTGSGKTHTMHTFERNVASSIAGRGARVTYFEVKGKRAFDLLRKGDRESDDDADTPLHDAPRPLTLMDDVPGSVVNACTQTIETPDALLALLRRGRRRRATAATDVNGGSSRSHAVCRLNFDAGGSLTLVDCAGSERSQDSLYHDKQRIKESVEINESLYALKRCIRASRQVKRWKSRGGFDNPDQPIPAPPPFRGSALTRVLREAFVADDACLSVVATVSPSATDAEHTVSTLRTVCELAGTSQAAQAASDPKPRTVPKIRHGIAAPGPRVVPARHGGSKGGVTTTQTSNALPPFPNKWSASRLAAFLATRCHLSGAADRALKLELDGRRLSRMSAQAVAAALACDGEAARFVVDKLRTEAEKCAVLHKRAREQRRRELRGV